MIRVLRKVAILAALGLTVVLGGAQRAKADHQCAYGGYRGGYVDGGYAYRSGAAYHVRPSYPAYNHGYSYGQRHFSDYRPAPHFDVSSHTRRQSYSHHGHRRSHHN